MSVTKSQLLEQIKSQGFDDASYQSIVESLQQFPEQLSPEDVTRVDAVLADMQGVETLAASMHGEMADTLDKVADDMTDAADDHIEQNAKMTYNNVKLAQDLSK